jgi:hypothetical protein
MSEMVSTVIINDRMRSERECAELDAALFDWTGTVGHLRWKDGNGEPFAVRRDNLSPFVKGMILEATKGVGCDRFTDLSPLALDWFLKASEGFTDRVWQRPLLGARRWWEYSAEVVRGADGKFFVKLKEREAA